MTSRSVLEGRWGPTDAVLAFYMTKNSRNDAKKAHYLRERTGQKLIGAVDSSFYRLLSLQKTVPMAQKAGVNPQRSGVKDAEPLHRKTHFN